METTIFRTIKGSQMEELFEALRSDVSIRFYKAMNLHNNEYSHEKKYKFETFYT